MQEREENERGLHIFGCGPLLDDLPFTWAFSRLVRNETETQKQVTRLAAEGVDFIRAYQRVNPSALAAIVETAGQYGLKVSAHPRTTTVAEACRLGVCSLEGLAYFLEPEWMPEQDWDEMTPADRARLWAHVDLSSSKINEWVERLVEQKVTVCPALLAARRRANLDEAINDPYLDYMSAVMPYHRHLKNMRNPFRYAVGKTFLKRYMPVASLDKAEQKEVEEGLLRMRDMLQLLHEKGVKLAIGSDSPT